MSDKIYGGRLQYRYTLGGGGWGRWCIYLDDDGEYEDWEWEEK